jgi:hypothetical protein
VLLIVDLLLLPASTAVTAPSNESMAIGSNNNGDDVICFLFI